MPTSSSHEGSISSFNSSLASFLSALLEEEAISDVEVVVDNAKLDGNNSFRSLGLLDSEPPKCRWNNLVRQGSDKDICYGRRVTRTRSGRSSNINRPSTRAVRRTVSDPSLGLQSPRRKEPTRPATQTKPKQRTTFISDSNLLRMPQRLPSPVGNPSSADVEKQSGNATWNKKTLNKETNNGNMFFDLMMEAEDHVAAKSKINTSLPTCLKEDGTLDTCSVRSSFSDASLLSDKEKAQSLTNKPCGHARTLSLELRTSLIKDLK